MGTLAYARSHRPFPAERSCDRHHAPFLFQVHRTRACSQMALDMTFEPCAIICASVMPRVYMLCSRKWRRDLINLCGASLDSMKSRLVGTGALLGGRSFELRSHGLPSDLSLVSAPSHSPVFISEGPMAAPL